MLNLAEPNNFKNTKVITIKSISVLLIMLFVFIALTSCTNMFSDVSYNASNSNTIRSIKGVENIKKYLAENDGVYEDNLVEIIEITSNSPTIVASNIRSRCESCKIGQEYVVRNKKSETYIDYGNILRDDTFPAGDVTVNDSFSIAATYSVGGGITAEFLTANLGFDVTGTHSLSVRWSGSYDYPVRLKLFPRYRKIVGEIYAKHKDGEAYVSSFEVHKGIGITVRV